MAAIREDELTVEGWCQMLGVDLEWYRRRVNTDALLHSLDTLTKELYVARERALERCRELMLDEDGHAAWAAVGEIFRLLGGDAATPDQLRELHESIFRSPSPVIP